MGKEMAKNNNGKRRGLGLVSWIVLLVCGIVFCGCGAYLGLYAKDKIEAENDFKGISENVEDLGLQGAFDENGDTIGWLKVPETKIDYPVMQTPEEPEYYLHTDFYGEYSESGTPFIDSRSRIGNGAGSYVDGHGTWNWFIYGHNMKFGTMFHDLLKYDEKDFWEKHRAFTFDAITAVTNQGIVTEYGEYEIVAACISKIREKKSGEFKYYQYPGYMDSNTFSDFVKGVKAESLYDTGVEPQYGEQLVTISTCAYHAEEGRFYIVGRKK